MCSSPILELLSQTIFCEYIFTAVAEPFCGVLPMFVWVSFGSPTIGNVCKIDSLTSAPNQGFDLELELGATQWLPTAPGA